MMITIREAEIYRDCEEIEEKELEIISATEGEKFRLPTTEELCADCPLNAGFSDWPGGRLPCGDFHPTFCSEWQDSIGWVDSSEEGEIEEKELEIISDEDDPEV